jgi:N12 class adenine-specific DNA methylase
VAERRKVEREINARAPKVEAPKVEQPALDLQPAKVEEAKPAPAQEAKPDAMPKELSGAKPRYNFGNKAFELNFASDLDKAAYIAAQDKPSKRDAEYLAHAMAAGNMTEDEVRAHGRTVREAIKAQARDASPGTLKIAPIYRQPTGATNAQTAEAQQTEAKRPEAPEVAPAPAAIAPAATENVAPAPEANKWFGSKEKADAYLAKKKLAGTHDVVQTGKVRFEVKPKAAAEPASTLQTTSSWVIKNKATGEVVMETFDQKKVDALNTEKYEAIPSLEHLQSLNSKKEANVNDNSTSGQPASAEEVVQKADAVSTPAATVQSEAAKEEVAPKARPMPDQNDPLFQQKNALRQLQNALDGPNTPYGVSWDGDSKLRASYEKQVADLQAEIAKAEAPAKQEATNADQSRIAQIEADIADWKARRALPINAGQSDVIDKEIASLESLADELRAYEREQATGTKRDSAQTVEKTAAEKTDPFAGNKLFTSDAVAKARARLKSKLGQLNSGIDPEMVMDGMTIAGAYIESGTRTFAAYAKAMVEDLGDQVKPYLLSFYEAARHYPGVDSDGMSSPSSARAQHEALMLDAAEVSKSKAAKAEKTENENEPAKLDQPSARELEGKQPDAVQGSEPQREAGNGTQGGSRADALGDVGTGGRGVQQSGSVGNDAREVSVPAGGATEGRGGEQGSKPVQRSERPAKPDPVERDAGNQPSLIPESGTRAQDRADGFVITEDDAIGEGGAKTKFKQNVAAIRLLKQLAAEGRQATRAEQAVLAKYVGWGGIPQAFYRDNGEVTKGWEKEAAELKDVMSEAELAAAAASTRNAHYTSPEVVTGVWDAVKHFGFQGGRTLEPSVGVGNFFGLMPTDLRSASQLTGVELDHVTGGIAKQLYPNANIQAPMGFQDFTAPNGYFDLAIGNPPFGSEGLYDPRNRKISGFSIHNYFFAKSIDAVKPNGVLAMVVTNRLLDKVGDKERSYIAQRAEFLGAIRLPNNAFSKNAGTEVTTDIIFLRKLKDGEQPGGQKWMEVKQYKDANGKLVPLNEYFIANPDMMLGDFGMYGSMYSPEDSALVARPGQDTPALLQAAIAKLPKGFMDAPTAAPALETIEPNGDISRVKVGSVFEQDGQIFERREDMLGKQQAAPVTFASDKARERVAGMIKVRDALIEVRGLQLTDGVNENTLEAARAELNKVYDAFVKANGPLNSDANKRLMRDDPTWAQIAALEDGFDKGISATVAKATGEKARAPSARKSAIFTKRTQAPYRAPESAKSAKDALVSSMAERGRVDLDYMASLYAGHTPDQIAKELDGLIFKNPAGGWESRDQYLSGNVKKKLAQAIDAAKADPAMRANVDALKAVQPADIEAVDIDVKTGAHWVPADVMQKFIESVSGGERAKALYNPVTASWTLSVERATAANVTEYSTDRASLTQVLEAAANQKQIVIRDKQYDGTSVLNEQATTAANAKVERVKAEWKNWLWTDDARRERLARIYNDTFNTDVQREFDGSHLTFPGKVGNDIIQLRPHQANAVWRMVQSGTTLLDHVVGAGKTFTMIAGIMEMRRMSLAKKPMLAVPNHLVGQWAEDFMKLYPGANILAATKKDFEKENRKKLFARIATGDWDAVIVAHSSFGKVEVEPEFQAAFIKQQIADMDTSISAMRAAEGKSSRNVKQIEKQKANLEEKLKKLFDTGSKDDNLYFSELGVDAILLDEAHEFKNLGFSTGMQRVAGLGNPAGSNKAADMFMKIQATLKRTGGKNVVFATGTPISNTMAEMYTMQRFLDYGTLKDQGIAHFDAWAKTFGEVVTDWELSPSGQYKMNSRFAKFVNMPELMQRYSSFADVVNRDDINRMLASQGKRLPVPKIKGGKPENTVVERSRDQAQYIGIPTVDENGVETYPEGSLIWRSENLPKKAVKGADNMLKIMSDARKAALDMRLIDPSYPDNPASKVNVSADNIKTIYDQWTADKGTQLVFIDLSTPKSAVAKEAAALRDLVAKAEEGDEAAQEKLDAMSPDELLALDSKFSVYDDLKAKLIARGIPENEIAFIHDANTELQKEDLFGKVRSGRVRVLFGSTAKMGAGMNVQERLVALHHLDAPWRPSDLEQREGRIIRQGNKLYDANPEGFEIQIKRYATKQTLDSRMWQTIEAKARFIEQVRKGTGSREVEDVAGEAANSAEMKAASSGNPLILEEMSLRQAIRKLENEQSEHNREQYRIKDRIRWAADYAAKSDKQAAEFEADAPLAPAQFEVRIGNQKFDKHGEAGQAILDAVNAMYDAGKDSREIGSYGGFKLTVDDVSTSLIEKRAVLTIEGKGSYQIEANPGSAPTGLALRLQNTVKTLKADAEQSRKAAERERAEVPKLEAKIKPWGSTKELADAKTRHAAVIEQLRPKKKPEAAKPEDDAAFAENDVTDTPEFKRWFGDSKVVDAKGKPLVVYHGTIVRPDSERVKGMGDIASFDRMFTTKFRSPSIDTVGSWFSTNPGEGGAQMYSGSGQGSAIYPVYLSIKNPQVTTFQLMTRRARLLQNGKDDGRMIGAEEVAAYRKWLNDTGKDGIKIEGSGNDGSTEFDNQVAWIALEPEQIKSATGNNGDFDPANPDIRFDEAKGWGKIDADTIEPLPTLTDAQSKKDIALLEQRLDGKRGLESLKDRPYRAVRLRDADILGAIGEAFGVRAVGFDLNPGADQKYDFFSGVTFKASGSNAVYLGARSTRPHLALLGHETAHQLRTQRPDLYNKLVDAVSKYVDVAKYESEFVNSPVAVNVKTVDGKQEEFMGEVLSDAFMDPIFWNTLAKEGKSVFKNVYNIVMKLLGKLAGTTYTKKAAPYLTDYDRVMQIAGEVLAELEGKPAPSKRSLFGLTFAENDAAYAEKDIKPEGLTPPDQGLLRRIQAAVQDNMNRVREVQDRIEKRIGRKLPEYADYYGAETNRPGRIAARLEDARNELIQPLMEELAKSGHTMEQLDELLHAQHAEERNKKVAEINPEFPDGGSGMMTADANAILAKYKDDGALQSLAGKARRIARDTLDLKLAYGLIDQETHETLTQAYKAYVPLKGTGEYGPKIKKAMGHGERDEHILENLTRDYELAVVAGERNLARQSLLQMVLQNPDSELWTVGAPPKGRYIAGQSFDVYKSGKKVNSFDSAAQAQAWVDGRTDGPATYIIQTDRRKFIVERDGVPVQEFYSYSKAEDYIANIKEPAGKLKIVDAGETVREFVKPLQDNEVMVYVDGRPVRIQIADEKLAGQLRPMNQNQMGFILEKFSQLNRYLSRIYTGYSPTFLITNPLRDMQTGTVTMLGNFGAGMAGKAWAQYPAAMKALFSYARTGTEPNSEMGKMLKEYRMNGGKTGASHMSDLEEQGKTLQRLYDDAYGAKAFLADGKPTKAALIAGRKALLGMAHVIEVMNVATENGLRLALYAAMRNSGESSGKAAQAAKNVTVNFDRKGSQTPVLSALFLFFNPAVQGTANAMRAIAQGDHKKQAWFALGVLAALGMWAAAQGLDGDEDRWLGEGWDTRSKKLVLNIGGTKITIPLSMEFAPFYAAGVAIEEARRGAVKPIDSAGRIISSFIDAYVPFKGLYNYDSDNKPLDAATSAVPTVLRPAVEAATNRNTFGSKIVPENDFTKDRPDNLKMNRNTKGTPFDSAAQGIAAAGEMLGEGRYENGLTKISPETLKHWWRTYTGGLGTFIGDSVGLGKLALDDPKAVEMADVPVVKAFAKGQDVTAIRGRFYEMTKDIRATAEEFKQAKKAGDGEAMDKILNTPSKAELLGLERIVTKTTQAAAKLRDAEVDINADKTMPLAERRAAIKELQAQEEALYRAAIEAFK